MGIILRGRPEDGLLLPTSFLTGLLPDAPPEYVTAFLYACGLCAQNGACELAAVAEGLSRDAEDVRGAFRYWRDKGYVTWNEPGEDMALLLGQAAQPQSPDYAPEELSLYLERSSDLRKYFSAAEKMLGRLLSHKDMETLFGLYDWLHLPIPVLLTLVRYCNERGIRSLHYLERAALSWAEAGIDTPEKAAAYLEAFTDGCREVCSAFGLRDRALTPAEAEFVKKWRRELEMPLPLLTLACQRTVLQTGKISFPYADKILSAWHSAGVKTPEDVEKLDRQRKETRAAAPAAPRPAAASPSKFANFEQRELDFDQMAQRKKEQLNRSRGGNHGKQG